MELPQTNLFGEIENDCQREWNGMPEYQNVKQEDPEITATFKFRNYKDFKRFETQVKNCLYDGERVFEGKQLKDKKSTWYPLNEKASIYRYVSKKMFCPGSLFILSVKEEHLITQQAKHFKNWVCLLR